jgi:O-antigen chain-terminating methyltransferase
MSDSDHFPELAQKLQVIRERVRARIKRTPPPLPDGSDSPALSPVRSDLQLARRQAAAIGSLNPRPPGLGNELIQSAKRALLRITSWQIRPQRDFNQAVLKSLEGLERNLAMMHKSAEQQQAMLRQALEQRDRRQQEFGEELDALCEQITLQRWSYEGALMRQTNSLERLRSELESWSHELQTLRQRVASQAKAQAARAENAAAATAKENAAAAAAAAANGNAAAAVLPVDYYQLEKHFRGTEEEIRNRQRFYLPYFRERKQVLDIACGRGEFLELMRESGVQARGVDLDADMVGRCLEKGLNVAQGDVFSYLEGVSDGALDGIFSSQFVEHLDPQAYLRLIAQCATKLAPGGVLALETQNPECLAIFSQSFFLDPTHVRPIPPAQLRFALIEAGLERVTTHSLSPASATLPLVPPLPDGAIEPGALQAYNLAVAKFNETFFGGMDYAVIGYRPASASAGSAAG